MKRFRTLPLLCLIFWSFTAFGNDSTDVKWSLEQQRLDDNSILLTIKAYLGKEVKMYALSQSEQAILYSTLSFDSSGRRYLAGPCTEHGSLQVEEDTRVDATVRYFSDSVLWQQQVHASRWDRYTVKGTLHYLYQKGEHYIPGEKRLEFFISPPIENAKPENKAPGSPSVLWIFLSSFGGGLLSLLTPCVYSMIPVTVSFFTKQSATRKAGITNAVFYAASIVFIFTLLGFLVTLIFGPAALNNLATHWVANLLFFALFSFFGLSFLGAFEITLPASWSNRAGKNAGMSSLAGIFFMALTLVLVSFSCTGPIIGNLLVLASRGSYYGPLIGMAGFSLALALPFAIFAFFPSKLNLLGKAGGWLNAVKVTLGFLELALALKFLSNADLARGWRLLDREVFLAAWIVIFSILGFYLLGKLKFHHDDELPKNDFGHPYLGVKRLFFAMAAFLFALYMLPGIWGAPLQAISAFVPPMGTQDFRTTGGTPFPAAAERKEEREGLPPPILYHEQMKLYEPEVVARNGLITYYDYAEALAVARKFKKPLMLDFTGISCVNCRKMEGQVWSDVEVMKTLKEDFVIASLYVDVHHIELDPMARFYSGVLGKTVVSLGDQNAHLQVTRFGAHTQPYYFFLDGDEKELVAEGYGYDPSNEKFLALLQYVKATYDQR